jgi:hypothetical protein
MNALVRGVKLCLQQFELILQLMLCPSQAAELRPEPLEFAVRSQEARLHRGERLLRAGLRLLGLGRGQPEFIPKPVNLGGVHCGSFRFGPQCPIALGIEPREPIAYRA